MSDVSPWPWASTECTLASCAWEAKDWTATELKPPGQFRNLVTISHPIPPPPKMQFQNTQKQAQPQKKFHQPIENPTKMELNFLMHYKKIANANGLKVLTPTQIAIPKNSMQAWPQKFPPKWSWSSGWCTIRKLLTMQMGSGSLLKIDGSRCAQTILPGFSFFTRSVLASPRFPPSSLNGADQTTHS